MLKRSWAGEVRNVSLLVAIGYDQPHAVEPRSLRCVNSEGYREILGICEGAKEDRAGWSAFLKPQCRRGKRATR
jgi:transposase-like protein